MGRSVRLQFLETSSPRRSFFSQLLFAEEEVDPEQLLLVLYLLVV